MGDSKGGWRCHIGSLFAFRAVARWFWERKRCLSKGV